MQIGVVYPQIELGGDPSAVRRIGKVVEDLGFDYLLAYDHVLGAVHADRTPQLPGPYTELDPFMTRSSCSATLPASPSGSASPPGYSCCRSAKPRCWHARPPTSISYPADGCASVSASAGTTSNTKPSGRTSAPAAHARKSRSNCCGDCSTNPLSTSRVGSTESTEPHCYRSRHGPSHLAWRIRRESLRPGRPARGRLHLPRRQRHRPRRRCLEGAARTSQQPGQVSRGLRGGVRDAQPRHRRPHLRRRNLACRGRYPSGNRDDGSRIGFR
jgi:hypothetical protein